MNVHPDIQPLIHALRDHRDGLRQFATRRLVKMGEAAVPALIEALKDTDEQVQEAVAIAIITIGPRALVHLMTAMHHDDRRIRWGACWVLSSMPPEVRAMLPRVRIPAALKVTKESNSAVLPVIAAQAADSGMHHGVWSDSWLSKVRERLASNRVTDVLEAATRLAPAEPA
ncbi:MAG TPA: HEAT repeat domain-containing protein [Planctomycetota bacterium]|nr:HEAT repeat domain-containing protein [Planctomycetota bacterium]